MSRREIVGFLIVTLFIVGCTTTQQATVPVSTAGCEKWTVGYGTVGYVDGVQTTLYFMQNDAGEKAYGFSKSLSLESRPYTLKATLYKKGDGSQGSFDLYEITAICQ